MDLGKPDPNGYYVLIFNRKVLDEIKSINGILVEEYGDIIIVRLKSRALAKRLLVKYRNCLANL